MPQEVNRKVLGMWMLLLRTANTESKVHWFVLNGVPIRYSIREHALISGLDCLEYPCNKEDLGSGKFKKRNFVKNQTITVAAVREKLLSMNSCGDRLKMAVLYFLCTVIKGKAKFDGPIDPFLVRIVDDLEACKTFPWGRFTFEDVASNVYHLMKHLDGFVNGMCNIPGFIVPLEILAFECIPNLKKSFREDVEGCNSECPRMCKQKFKGNSMKGYPLEEICDALGTTKKISSFWVPDLDEEILMTRIIQGESDEEGDGNITDRWNDCLTVEHKRIWWKDMYELDVTGRVFRNTKEKKQVKNVESPGFENVLKELEERMIKTMEEGFKGMEGKIHDGRRV